MLVLGPGVSCKGALGDCALEDCALEDCALGDCVLGACDLVGGVLDEDLLEGVLDFRLRTSIRVELEVALLDP